MCRCVVLGCISVPDGAYLARRHRQQGIQSVVSVRFPHGQSRPCIVSPQKVTAAEKERNSGDFPPLSDVMVDRLAILDAIKSLITETSNTTAGRTASRGIPLAPTTTSTVPHQEPSTNAGSSNRLRLTQKRSSTCEKLRGTTTPPWAPPYSSRREARRQTRV